MLGLGDVVAARTTGLNVVHIPDTEHDVALVVLAPELAVKHADLLDWAQDAAEWIQGIQDTPATTGPAHDKAHTVTSYRALHEHTGPLLARLAALLGEGEHDTRIVGADE